MTSEPMPVARTGRPATAVLAGVGITLGVVVAAAVPVVVMLFATPRGTPFPLADPAMVGLFALAGLVIGLLVAFAGRRGLRALVAGLLLLLLAIWLSSGVWPALSMLPTPPLLPTVPSTLTLAAGLALGVVLLGGGARSKAAAGSARVGSVLLGVVAAVGVVVVTEAEVWGRGVIRTTFVAPAGLSTPAWSALVFVAVVIAGLLVGAVLTARDRSAALVAIASVAIVVVGIALIADLGGQPRTTRYGLALGVFVVAALRGPAASGDVAAPDALADPQR